MDDDFFAVSDAAVAHAGSTKPEDDGVIIGIEFQGRQKAPV